MEGVEENRGSFKRLHVRLILIILIVIVVTIISVTIFYFLGGKENNPIRDVVNDAAESIGIDLINNEPLPPGTPIFGGSSSGAGGSGSGSSSSTSSGSSGGGLNCQEEQIAYSLLNINKTTNCNLEQSGICVDRTVSCSIEVHNDDSSVAGTFEIELFYVEQGKNKSQALDYEIKNFVINPLQFELFQDSTNIQSTGENGSANQEINCIFQMVDVPKKQVCV